MVNPFRSLFCFSYVSYLNELSLCSQAMSEDERVDLVSFTGSTPVKYQSTFLFKGEGHSKRHIIFCHHQ